jgi:beta-glucosidase
MTGQADPQDTLQPATRFPNGFVWGVAASAYQIEGAFNEDGRGESIWDRFCRMPGRVDNSDTGDVACDHYHRFFEDVGLMASLGIRGYRFSIAWPRILPEGRGRVNGDGMDFYHRLVDRLLEAGIEPYITLYHWDLPQALQDRGGWASRDTVDRFQEYVSVVSQALGDRASHWITHNEPWVVAFGGHYLGVHAPGIKDSRVALQVAHHLLLAHGKAVQVLRHLGSHMMVGIDLNLSPVHPATTCLKDQEAAARYDGCLNRWFLDAIFKRAYPQDLLAWYADKAPRIEPGDMELIGVRVDFLGVNYYSRIVIRADVEDTLLGVKAVVPAGSEVTETGWEVYPQGIVEVLCRVHDEYQHPAIYVTENGAAFRDEMKNDGEIDDRQRLQFLSEHISHIHRAIQQGIDLRGYFVWSLMDVFEWDSGYSKPFGIVHVDRNTLKRTVKKSGLWYRQFIEQQARVRESG